MAVRADFGKSVLITVFTAWGATALITSLMVFGDRFSAGLIDQALSDEFIDKLAGNPAGCAAGAGDLVDAASAHGVWGATGHVKWALGLAALVLVPVVIVAGLVMPTASMAAAQLCAADPGPIADPGPQGKLSNAAYIWTALRSDGLSEAAAAGVLGNLQQESGLDPRLQQSGGPGVGLAQWSRGERWDGPGGLVPWAQRRGLDAWSLQTQVTWMLREMHQGWGGFDLARFRAMTDVLAATVYFHDTYEVSADSAEQVRVTRGGYARGWYRRLRGIPVTPRAGRVFIVGDSLTVGSAPAIRRLYRQRQRPAPTITARDGLTTRAAARLLDSPAARAATTWVAAVGTNDFNSSAFKRAAEAIAAAAGERQVLWINILRPRQPQPINRQIARLADRYSTVRVVDFAAAAATRRGAFTRDGVHLTAVDYRWRAQFYLPASAPVTPQPFDPEECDPGSGGAATCPTAPDRVLPAAVRGHMKPNALAVADCVAAGWPEIRDMSASWRPSDPYPDHPSGQAVDIMIPQGCAQTAGKLKLGNDIAAFLMKYADAYRIQYIIWQQRIWTIPEGPKPLAGWRGMAGRGSCTADHMDHVHVSTYEPPPGNPSLGGFTYRYKTPASATRPCPPRLACGAGGGRWVKPTASSDWNDEAANPGNDPGNTRGAPNDHGRYHAGWDIAAPMGQPIVATAAGGAHTAQQPSGAGNYVTIDHGGGVQSLYMHLSRFANGINNDHVTAGTVIGYIGSTGRSTGPHLHFEVRVNGQAKDPRHWLLSGHRMATAC